MSKLVPPHGGKGLTECLLEGAQREEELKKAQGLKKIEIHPQEKGDLIMMGIGGFSPLTGFMTRADWKSVCEKFTLADGTFWPVPVMLSVGKDDAADIKEGDEITLECEGEIYATMKVEEKYAMSEEDKKWEAEMVYKGNGEDSQGDFLKTALEDHVGVQKVMQRKEFCLAGPVKVLSEGDYPTNPKYRGSYMRPSETRKIFEERGWSKVAALQLRNPMHRSHEHLAKIAIDVCDGVLIHSLIGNLKPGDIPADVRLKCIDTLIDGYFVKENILQGGYPLDMRYAGPREALLHATFRQNYGCSQMIIGRDHAGVGDFYTLFEAQEIFDRIPYATEEERCNVEPGKALLCEPMKIDWTFYCFKCDGMASMKTCPHTKEDRVILSGTKLRKALSEGQPVPDHFGREEVLNILREYYEGLTEKVEIKMQKAASGDEMK
ncbi:sulfate adenylyltransferase [Desulfohalobium retbaense]|uniref:sulfate adenylyltransferase n=1 Tax=Desulfohalobium retbaense (strain ATCC 49708 / DSM 5692 / JCM 16813 / HR100) TaxID=485915 RepID=C8X4M9_DESRD|nr:sulfate adenylyltransferase [Desulfohalobium retbaense]ACV69252.1 sulfate adenylyltransferase [Desulfohalobium retbaense DSM 5692]